MEEEAGVGEAEGVMEAEEAMEQEEGGALEVAVEDMVEEVGSVRNLNIIQSTLS